MDGINLNRLRYFVAVVDTGTITGAARILRVSKAVVSKQILLLEDEIGSALLQRNTRHLYPTEAGLRFFEQAKAALAQVEEAFAEAKSGSVTPSGSYRMTAPMDYGTLHLAPLVAQFVQDYPEVQCDLHLSDGLLDPVEYQFDLSFRVGWPEDSSNRMRKVGEFEEWVVASPQLAGAVDHPDGLRDHSFIANANLKNATRWRFSKAGMAAEILVEAPVRLNSTPAIAAAIAARKCWSVLPDYLVHDDIAMGRVCRLLPDWSLRRGGIYAISPPAKHKPLAIRIFSDMVAAYHGHGFGGSRPLSKGLSKVSAES